MRFGALVNGSAWSLCLAYVASCIFWLSPKITVLFFSQKRTGGKKRKKKKHTHTYTTSHIAKPALHALTLFFVFIKGPVRLNSVRWRAHCVREPFSACRFPRERAAVTRPRCLSPARAHSSAQLSSARSPAPPLAHGITASITFSSSWGLKKHAAGRQLAWLTQLTSGSHRLKINNNNNSAIL